MRPIKVLPTIDDDECILLDKERDIIVGRYGRILLNSRDLGGNEETKRKSSIAYRSPSYVNLKHYSTSTSKNPSGEDDRIFENRIFKSLRGSECAGSVVETLSCAMGRIEQALLDKLCLPKSEDNIRLGQSLITA